MALFWYAPEKCPKERANGGTHGSPLDPPSFRRPHSGRTGLKGQFFYSNEVSTTRTGGKVAQWQYSNILQLKSPACRIEKTL